MQSYKDQDVLEKLYQEHQDMKKVAAILNANPKTIAVWMKKFDIKRVGSQGARKNHLNHNYFERIDSEAKAYWLGFLMADGCIYRGSDAHSYRLQINLKGSDIEHLNLFQEAIGSAYKIQEKKIRESDVCLLKVNSTKMCHDLMKWKVTPRKSLVCEMPEIDASLHRHYVRGYFDGDGCLDWTHGGLPRARIGGGELMLTAIQAIAKDAGIASRLYAPSKGQKIYSLEWTDSREARKFASWMYDNSVVSLKRKQEIYESYP